MKKRLMEEEQTNSGKRKKESPANGDKLRHGEEGEWIGK